jgi:nucleotide-binding universal stress UspA family protein
MAVGKMWRVLAPVGDDPKPLAALLSPLAALRPLEVTLFRVGEGGKLHEAERVFRAHGLPPKTRAGPGDPAREIALFAKVERFDLLAMISHGRRGLRRAVLGSVAEQVLRHTRFPLLLGHPDLRPLPWRIVAAAVDGSAASECIVERAAGFAKAAGTPLHLVRVHPAGEARAAREGLDALCRRLDRKGIVALPFLRQGDPAAQLLRYATEIGVGLLCLSTHARDGLQRWMLGSVTEAVARRSPCPVYIAHR